MNQSALDTIIDVLRKEMIKTGLEEGLNADRTIWLSQTLDRYLSIKMSLPNLMDTNPNSSTDTVSNITVK